MDDKKHRKKGRIRVPVTCDMCGKEFQKLLTEMDSKHNFCCPQCCHDYASKKKNPEGYKTYRDYTECAARFSKMNREDNPAKRPEVRKKFHERQYHKKGEGKTYCKWYGRHEHRVVAEQILGRPLNPGEIVHHIDNNKLNNSPENIFVFPSQKEHAKFHTSLKWFIRDVKRLDEVELAAKEHQEESCQDT